MKINKSQNNKSNIDITKDLNFSICEEEYENILK